MKPGVRGRVITAVIVAAALSGFTAPALAAGRRNAPSSTTSAKEGFVVHAKGGAVAVYASPGDPTPMSSFTNPTPTAGELVFLVKRFHDDGWIKVLLPIRPNGSTGWVASDQVTIHFNPYRIEVGLGAHELTLFKGKRVVLREPVGIGKATTPTPGGRYYITQLFEPANPNGPYGPYAYSLSGFSEALDSFNGGEAVVGIHGTNHPELVGQDVSSGCIRMRNDGIRRVRVLLPLGTPVSINA